MGWIAVRVVKLADHIEMIAPGSVDDIAVDLRQSWHDGVVGAVELNDRMAVQHAGSLNRLRAGG